METRAKPHVATLKSARRACHRAPRRTPRQARTSTPRTDPSRAWHTSQPSRQSTGRTTKGTAHRPARTCHVAETARPMASVEPKGQMTTYSIRTQELKEQDPGGCRKREMEKENTILHTSGPKACQTSVKPMKDSKSLTKSGGNDIGIKSHWPSNTPRDNLSTGLADESTLSNHTRKP